MLLIGQVNQKYKALYQYIYIILKIGFSLRVGTELTNVNTKRLKVTCSRIDVTRNTFCNN